MRTFFKIFLIAVFAVYVGTVFVLPPVFNMLFSNSAAQKFLESKTESKVVIKGCKLSISPLFRFIFKANDLYIEKNDENIFDLKDVKFDFSPFNGKNDSSISIGSLYILKTDLNDIESTSIKRKNLLILKSNLPICLILP